MEAPDGWKVLAFYEFNGQDNNTTKGGSMFITQLGEASTVEHISLQSCSISSWA